MGPVFHDLNNKMQLLFAPLLTFSIFSVLGHPHQLDRAEIGKAAGRQKRNDDFVVIEAEEPRQGRLLISDTPVDDSAPNVANFRLPLPDGDDAIAGRFISDIPRDHNFGVVAGPRLPLTETFDDFVVVEAAGDEDGEGRALSDIPRDFSGPNKAGFKLPKPDLGSISEVFDDFEIVEVGDFEESGRSISETPTDNSGVGKAGFRLPINDDVVVLETDFGRDSLDSQLSLREKSDCFKPLKRSRCRALLSFWFFNNHSKQRQEYKFGGCDEEDHSNRFSSEEECRQVCLSGDIQSNDITLRSLRSLYL